MSICVNMNAGMMAGTGWNWGGRAGTVARLGWLWGDFGGFDGKGLLVHGYGRKID